MKAIFVGRPLKPSALHGSSSWARLCRRSWLHRSMISDRRWEIFWMWEFLGCRCVGMFHGTVGGRCGECSRTPWYCRFAIWDSSGLPRGLLVAVRQSFLYWRMPCWCKSIFEGLVKALNVLVMCVPSLIRNLAKAARQNASRLGERWWEASINHKRASVNFEFQFISAMG